MKHCIIMTAYKDVGMINKIIARTPDDWGIYIHLDRKSDIKVSEIDSRAKTFKKYKIYWGGVEHIKAVLMLLREAINMGVDYDYFHIITGQDYFVTDPGKFDFVLGLNKNNYIEVNTLPNKNWGPCNGSLDLLRYRHLSSFGDVRKGLCNSLDKKFVALQKKFKLEKAIPDFAVYQGLFYCSLHKEFVAWLLEARITQCLLKILKHSLVGEEVFFQTVIMHSPYKDTVINNNLRYCEWSQYFEPMILCEADMTKIVDPSKKILFCRKLSSNSSLALIERLDNK